MNMPNFKLDQETAECFSKTSPIQEFEVLSSTFRAESFQRRQVPERWFLEVERDFAGNPSSRMMTINVLQFLLQTEAYVPWQIENAEDRLRNLLLDMKSHFLGLKVPREKVLMRLPDSVLRKATRDDVLFHQVLFHQGQHGFIETMEILWKDYLFRPLDLLWAAGLLFFLSLPFGRELLTGVFFGYLLSTWVEYLVHLKIAHANPKMRALLKTWGSVGEDMLRFSTEHNVHHFSVKQNYVDPFADSQTQGLEGLRIRKANRLKVDEALRLKGGEELLRLVRQSQYGLSSSKLIRTLLFFLPTSLLTMAMGLLASSFFQWGWGLAFAVGVILTGELWIFASAIYHPLLHRSRDSINQTQGFFLRTLLSSRFSGFVARAHRAHHLERGEVNQNLNLGADFLFGFKFVTMEGLLDLKMRNAPY